MSYLQKYLKRASALALAVCLSAGMVIPQGSTDVFAKEYSEESVAANSVTALGAENENASDRTILVYVCGSDIEHDTGYFTDTLNEMMEAKIDEGINVLVLTGGAKSWSERLYTREGDKVSPDKYNQVWKLTGKTDSTEHGYMTLLEEKGIDGVNHISMEDPKMLKAFMNYAAEKYPAKTYDMILVDHGMGPARGYCDDDVVKRTDGKSALSVAEMISAISESKIEHFDFINFHCCLMGNIEVATAFVPYTDYLITSSETMPATGEKYKRWLNSLSADHNLDGWAAGKMLVDDSIAYYEEVMTKGDMTLAVINTKNLKERLLPQMRALNSVLLDEADHKGSINGKYNYYDELYSKNSAIKFYEPSLYDLGNIVNAFGIDLNEPDNSTKEDLAQLKNKYTKTAVEIDNILQDNDGSGDDVVYAKCTSGMMRQLETGIKRDTDGNLVESEDAALEYSGLSLYFGVDCTNDGLGNLMRYIESMEEVLATDPDKQTKAFYEEYLKSMLHYNLIAHVGNAVSALTAQGDKEITVSDIKTYWQKNTFTYKKHDYNEYDVFVKVFAKAGASEEWLTDILNQQLGEVLSSDKISVSLLEDADKAGAKGTYRVDVKDVPLSVTEGVYMKLKAVVIDCDGGPDMNAVLSRKAVSGTPSIENLYKNREEGDGLADVLSRMYSSQEAGFDVSVFDNQWYVMKSAADGTKDVITCLSEPDAYGNMLIPVTLFPPEKGGSKGALKVRYDEGTNSGTVLGFIPGTHSLADSENVETEINGLIDLSDSRFDGARIILDGTDESGKASYFVSDFINFTKEPDRGLSVEKMDLSGVNSVRKNDDGTPKIEVSYYVKDSYGFDTDITEAVKAADSGNMLKNLSHAVISNIKTTDNGKIYSATVKYNTTTLVKDRDYEVKCVGTETDGTKNLVFLGIGDYAGYQTKTYTIPVVTDLSKAKVTLKKSAATYNGKVQNPSVKSVTLNGKTIPESAYTVSILNAKGTAKASPKNAGSYVVKITGNMSEYYTGSAKATYKINPVANTIKFAGKSTKKALTIKVKRSSVKKKAKTFKITRKGKGKISITKKCSAKRKKYISLSKGKVVLKKKAPKGKYKFIITVAANSNWKKTKSKLITLKVK